MKITRRYFLKSTGAVAVYCGISPLDLLGNLSGKRAEDNPVRAGKTLVVIFLRGGMDGLNFLVPYRDPAYYDLRSSIAISQPGQGDNAALDVDGFFGLHPRAGALAPLFQDGSLTALHAVGYAHNTRSHFEEQDTWETGVIGNTIESDGWLNRHLLTSEGRGPIRAVTIGDSLPRILQGGATAYSLRGLSDLGLPGAENPSEIERMQAALEHAYCTPMPEREFSGPALDLLSQSGRTTLEGVRHLNSVARDEYVPQANYPDNGFGAKMQTVARLIKSNIGLEVAEVTLGGWDTHNNQSGAFGNLSQTLADSLAAFHKDLGSRMDDVMVLTLSDFGRTAHENGTRGTDHGWGNCMLAMGGPVARARKLHGQPVLGTWPGLGPEQLNQGRDLLHTTDFRDVIGEVVSQHLGNAHIKTVLPGHPFKPVGLLA